MGYPKRTAEGGSGGEVYAAGADKFDGAEALCEVLSGKAFCWGEVFDQVYYREVWAGLSAVSGD